VLVCDETRAGSIPPRSSILWIYLPTLPVYLSISSLLASRCLPFRFARNEATRSPRIRRRTAQRRETVAFDVTGYRKKDVPRGRGICDSPNASKLARYGLQSAREERVSRFARWSQVTPPPLPPVTRVTKLVPIKSSSELKSRFKGVVVPYCKVSIDSSQRCTVFSKYLG